LEALKQAGFADAALFGRRIHVLAHDVAAATERIRGILEGKGIRVEDIAPRAPTLEDVFVWRILERERAEVAR